MNTAETTVKTTIPKTIIWYAVKVPTCTAQPANTAPTDTPTLVIERR